MKKVGKKIFAEVGGFADTTAGTFPPRSARTEKSFES
jgi:hypothetical protein